MSSKQFDYSVELNTQKNQQINNNEQETQQNGQNWKSIAISFSILLIVFLIDFIYKDELFEMNHQLVLKVQKSEDHFISRIWALITQLGYTTAVVSVLVGFYLFYPNKLHAISTIIYVSSVSFFLSNLKMIYSDPRPYFKYKDINGYGCDMEFGKPSGHAMVSINLYFLLIDGYMRRQYQNSLSSTEFIQKFQGVKMEQNKELIQLLNQTYQRVLLNPKSWQFYIYSTVIFLIGYSRVYMGVHSFNQVILGWAYGQFLLTLYLTMFQAKLNELLAYFVYKIFKDDKQLQKMKTILTLNYVGLILITLAAYFYSVSTVDQQSYDDWFLVVEKCKDEVKIDHFLYNKCLNDSVSLSVVFAMLISMLYTHGEYKPEEFNQEHRKLKFSVKFLRVIVFLIVVGGPLVFFKKFFTVGSESVLLKFFLGGVLGSLVYGIFFVKVLPFVYYKLKISIDGDLFKFTEDCRFCSCPYKTVVNESIELNDNKSNQV